MFFLIDIKTKLKISPDKLDSNFKDYIKRTLKLKYELKLDIKYGYIIKIESIKKVSTPKIIIDGSIIVVIDFEALVFHPIRGQIVNGVVSSMNRIAIFCTIGPINAAISRMSLNKDIKYNDRNFFEDKESYQRIKEGTLLRLKILLKYKIEKLRVPF